MKTEQNYKNYIRWYVPHHFVFYPVMLALMVFTGYRASQSDGEIAWLWAMACVPYLGRVYAAPALCAYVTEQVGAAGAALPLSGSYRPTSGTVRNIAYRRTAFCAPVCPR